MPTIETNGIALSYEEFGQGAPILGIHGTPSSVLLWVDAAKRLAERGRCIVYERRGFPRSPVPGPLVSLDLSDHVEDAAALLTALEAAPAVVIGRSTGGEIALELARRFPDVVRALVLLEPAVFTVDPDAASWAQDIRRRVREATSQDPSTASEVVVRSALGDDRWEAMRPDVRQLFAAASPAVVAEMRGQGLDLGEEPVTLSPGDLAAIRQPTLLVCANDSPDALHHVIDRLGEALPRTETVRVPGDHLIDPAHDAVLSFLDRVTRSPVA